MSSDESMLAYADAANVVIIQMHSSEMLKEVRTDTIDEDGAFGCIHFIQGDKKLILQSRKYVTKLDIESGRQAGQWTVQ